MEQLYSTGQMIILQLDFLPRVTGDIPSFIVTNSFNNELISTITVTPTYTNNGISCDGPSETFTITVNPTAQVDSIS